MKTKYVFPFIRSFILKMSIFSVLSLLSFSPAYIKADEHPSPEVVDAVISDAESYLEDVKALDSGSAENEADIMDVSKLISEAIEERDEGELFNAYKTANEAIDDLNELQ